MVIKGDKMVNAVVAMDLKDEPLGKIKNFQGWLNERNVTMTDDHITHEDYTLEYIYYEQANIYLFKFNNDGDFFPPILVDYINHLSNANETQISVAEEGDFEEYKTLVDMTLKDFKNYVLKESDDESE
tara:strand:- start:460 stop:843 length:384 start_codon:yes stop_codon:yes gene_type:complete